MPVPKPKKEIGPDGKSVYSIRFWCRRNAERFNEYQTGFRTQREAIEWAEQRKKEIKGNRGGHIKTTVSQYLDRWMDIKDGKLAPSTAAGYEVNVRHIKEYIGSVGLRELSMLDVQEMADKLRTRKENRLKAKSVQYIIRTLHAALNYAVKAELVPKNVANSIEILPDTSEEAFTPVVLEPEQLEQLLHLLREQDHPIYPAVLLAGMRGLRRGECLALAWTDVDMEAEVAGVKQTYQKVKKKAIHKKVKTEDSERPVPLDGDLIKELYRLQEMNTKRGVIQKYVCEIDGYLPDPSHFSRRLKDFQKANKLPVCRFHDLRHTFGENEILSGTDIDTLKRLMGHSKLSTTSDLYLHTNVSRLRKGATNLDNLVRIDPLRKALEDEAKKEKASADCAKTVPEIKITAPRGAASQSRNIMKRRTAPTL